MEPSIGVEVRNGRLQGIVGAGTVRIENFTIYNQGPEEPAQSTANAGQVSPCPYPGLTFFGPDDAAFFFGRNQAVERLGEAVSSHGLTALVGASGAGKSSVVLAGLAPSLYKTRQWLFSYFRVGNELDRDPFRALARALVPFYIDPDVSETRKLENSEELAASLKAGRLTLPSVFSACRARHKGRRVLLIADQFEEMFTLVEDAALRQCFIDVLLAGFANSAGGNKPEISLVLTLRADFYGQTLRYRALADALQGRVENLGPMTRAELQDAIVCPAKAAGVSFEAGLVATLLDHVVSRPGNLPLLQFALREMWAHQEGRQMARSSYEAIGGIEGAIARRADAIFDDITAGGRDTQREREFRRLFTRLVTLGEGQEDTRRVVDRGELDEPTWALAQRLAGETNRLVVTNAPTGLEAKPDIDAKPESKAAQGTDEVRIHEQQTVEITHEALIRSWPRLVEWINRDRTFQAWLRQIRPSVELWMANPNDEGPLLRGGLLAQAADWNAKRVADLSDQEARYINASLALHQRQKDEKEAARQAELKREQEKAETAKRLAEEQRLRAEEQHQLAVFANQLTEAQRRRAAIARRIAWAASFAVVVASFLIVGLTVTGHEAARQTARAQGSLARIENDQGHHFEAAVAALAGLANPLDLNASLNQIAPWRELVRASAVDLLPPLRQEQYILFAKFDAKGERVLTASGDTVRLWDAHTGEPIGKPMRHQNVVYNAVFDAKGGRVLTASGDGKARLWDARTGEPIGKPMQQEKLSDAVFDPKGERVLTTSGDKMARLWDARTCEPIGKPIQHQKDSYGFSAVFDPRGERVLTALDSTTARLWDAHTGEPIGKPIQHKAAVHSAVFDAKGERVLTASNDKTARLWDARTGEPIGKPMQHEGWVSSAVFDPKGERVLTTSGDKTARMWDARTGESIGKPLQHQETVHSAVFDPKGERVLTILDDATARVWDAHTGELLGPPIGEPDSQKPLYQKLLLLTAAVFDPKGERVLIASDDKTARLWDARTGEPIGEPMQHPESILSAEFDPKGERVLTVSNDKTAHLWDVSSREPIGKPMQHKETVRSAVFDAKGERVLTASNDKTARLWDASTGEPIGKPMQHQGEVFSAVFDAKGERVLTASYDKTARLWNARTGEPIGKPMQHQGEVISAVFNAKGERVLTASDDKAAFLWDARTGEPIGKPMQHQEKVYSAVFDAEGERVLTASDDKTARLWDARTGEPIGKPMQHKEAVHNAVFDPNGERVLTISGDETARLWDARTGEPIAKPMQHQGAVIYAVFDAKGERVLTASNDKTARVWDARTGEPIGKSMQHPEVVIYAVFDPRGERVLTASDDNTVRLWDARTGQPIGEPMENKEAISNAVFDAKGERVLTASWGDGTARLWDAHTGEPIGEPMQHKGEVQTAVFDAKGERVLTASYDKTARVWDARTGEPIGKPMQHQKEVDSAVFDAKGERVLTRSSDNSVCVWRAAPSGQTLYDEIRASLGAHAPKALQAVYIMAPVTSLLDLVAKGFRTLEAALIKHTSPTHLSNLTSH